MEISARDVQVLNKSFESQVLIPGQQLVQEWSSGLTLDKPVTELLTGAIQKINVSLTREREK